MCREPRRGGSATCDNQTDRVAQARHGPDRSVDTLVTLERSEREHDCPPVPERCCRGNGVGIHAARQLSDPVRRRWDSLCEQFALNDRCAERENRVLHDRARDARVGPPHEELHRSVRSEDLPTRADAHHGGGKGRVRSVNVRKVEGVRASAKGVPEPRRHRSMRRRPQGQAKAPDGHAIEVEHARQPAAGVLGQQLDLCAATRECDGQLADMAFETVWAREVARRDQSDLHQART